MNRQAASRSLTDPPSRRITACGETVVLAALALVTTSVFAVERGFWWDDALHLAIVHRAGGTAWGWFTPVASPTRHLVGLPYGLALMTPWPALVLAAIYLCVWLGIGLATRALASRLFPGERLLAFLAGALVLTSTGDLLTDSSQGLHYMVTALCYLGAVNLALESLTSRRWLLPLLLSVIVLQGSLWDADIATPVIGVTPLLFALMTPRERWRRTLAMTLAWGTACLPFAWAFAQVLRSSASYVASHVPALPALTRTALALHLVAWDFTPWRWVFGRPAFYAVRPLPVPAAVLVAIASAATVVAVLVARRLTDDGPPVPRTDHRDVVLGISFLLLSGVTAIVLAGVHYSEVYARTQQTSRLWASLLVALITVRVAAKLHPRWVALLVPATFLFFGTWSGLQRQVDLAGAWSANVRELRSIVASVPRLAPGATLVLVHPPTPGLLATEAEYLAESWFDLLYNRKDGQATLVTWADQRRAGCLAVPSGFRCWKENQPPCSPDRPCPYPVRPYDQLVILVFDPVTGTYRLVEEIPPGLLGGRTDLGHGYQPHRWIVSGQPTALARTLLAQHAFLSRWLCGS